MSQDGSDIRTISGSRLLFSTVKTNNDTAGTIDDCHMEVQNNNVISFSERVLQEHSFPCWLHILLEAVGL